LVKTKNFGQKIKIWGQKSKCRSKIYM